MGQARRLLAGLLIVTLLYASSMRGLLTVEHKLFSDDPQPIRLLEAGVTIMYIVALVFTAYIARTGGRRAQRPAGSGGEG